MAAIRTSLANAFETQLTANVTDSDLTFPVGSIGSLTSPTYLVIDPDNPTKREYVFFDGTFTTSDLVTTTLANRGLAGSASGAQGHTKGAKVRAVPMQQHFEDLHDRMDTAYTVGGVDVAVTDGGTGASSAPVARANLGAAADAEVVHLAGAETISGAKTFSVDPTLADGSSALSLTEGNAAYQGRRVLDVEWYRDSGFTDQQTLTAAFAAIVAGDVVEFDPGRTYAVTANLTVSAADVVLDLRGASLVRNQDASWVLQVTGDRVTVKNGTLNASAVGTEATTIQRGCVTFVDADDGRVLDCRLVGAVNRAPVFFSSTVATKRVTVERCTIVDCYSTETAAKTNIAGVSVAAIVEHVRVRDCWIEGGTNPIDIGVFTSSDATRTVTNTLIEGCTVKGLARHGIGHTDEAPSATFDVGKAVIRDNFVINCREQGIKLKNIRRAIVTGNYIEGCNTVPEDGSTSLVGGIFLNLNEDVVCTGNLIVGDGTDGIRLEGLAPVSGGSTDGTGRANRTISDNVIKDCAGAGVYIHQRCHEIVVSGNAIHGCAQGVRVNSDTAPVAEQYGRSIAIVGNTIRDSGGTGIQCKYVYGLVIANNIVTTSQAFGIFWEDATEITCTGNQAVDNGQALGSRQGIRVSSNTVGSLVIGNISTNRDGATQDYGIGIAAGTTDVRLLLNDTEGNATGRVIGTPTVHWNINAAPGVSGSRGGNVALGSLLSTLHNLGLIVNNTTA